MRTNKKSMLWVFEQSNCHRKKENNTTIRFLSCPAQLLFHIIIRRFFFLIPAFYILRRHDTTSLTTFSACGFLVILLCISYTGTKVVAGQLIARRHFRMFQCRNKHNLLQIRCGAAFSAFWKLRCTDVILRVALSFL